MLLLKLQDFRNQTLKTCMQCNGNSCKLKEWSKDKKGDESIRSFYFAPQLCIKIFEKPDNVKSGRTKINFSYSINSKGKIKNISIISSKGAMNDRESYKYLQALHQKHNLSRFWSREKLQP